MQECTGGSALVDETTLDAAIREVKEELGINLYEKDAVLIGSKKRYYPNCPDFLDVYIFKSNVLLENVKIQKEEIKDVMWASKEKILKLYEEGNFEANAFFNEVLDFELRQNKMKKTNVKDYIGKDIKIKIDRKLGTRHPKHGFMYMLNYGYVPNTISEDGEELDAYLLGEFEPVDSSSGKVIAIIHRTNDDDDKLIVSKIGEEYSDDAIRALTEFQERFFESVIIR